MISKSWARSANILSRGKRNPYLQKTQAPSEISSSGPVIRQSPSIKCTPVGFHLPIRNSWNIVNVTLSEENLTMLIFLLKQREVKIRHSMLSSHSIQTYACLEIIRITSKNKNKKHLQLGRSFSPRHSPLLTTLNSLNGRIVQAWQQCAS